MGEQEKGRQTATNQENNVAHVAMQPGKQDWRKASEIDKVSSREEQNKQKQTENRAGS